MLNKQLALEVINLAASTGVILSKFLTKIPTNTAMY